LLSELDAKIAEGFTLWIPSIFTAIPLSYVCIVYPML